MFRKNGEPKHKVAINLLLDGGGMGDLLCYLITVDYIVKEVKYVDPLIWVPDYLLEFAKNVLPPEAKVYNYTTASKHYNDKLIGISTRWSSQHTAQASHPTDYANHVMIDRDLPIEKKNYLRFNNVGIDLTRFNLPEKYIVISVGSTAKPKELSPQLYNQLVEYIVEKGYTPVFLGKSESKLGEGKRISDEFAVVKAKIAEINYIGGIDLVNKTSLVESAAIISKAKAFVGMDGGLLHLAGFTDTKVIGGYTFVNPDVMGIVRNNKRNDGVYLVTPEESLACRYCQTNIPLLYNHDFRFCYYGEDDYSCKKQLTFDKWKDKIDEAL